MKLNTQFSVFQPNKPGVLARMIESVAHARVNLSALTVVDSHEQGVVRIVAEEADPLREVLKAMQLMFTETRVLEVEISNRPGALAKILTVLSEQKLNILYAYVTSGARGGRTTCILKTNNLEKAMKVLEQEEKRDKRKRRGGGKRDR